VEAYEFMKSGANKSKKQYSKPTLKMYGDIAVLTATVFNTSSNSDGGTGGMNKTH
jgi:hypothetical protein